MRYNKKKKPTKAESEHMDMVAQLSCCKCGERTVQIHHITEGGRRLGNFWVLPLCIPHHMTINDFQYQLELCRKIYKCLGKVMPEPTTKIIKRET